MKIILTGTSGLVGTDVWNRLKDGSELWAIGRNKPSFVEPSFWRTVDIRNLEQTRKEIAQINPDCVIHLAALSNPDDCENNPKEGYQTNALGTRNIAFACQRFDTELLYVSTDQVFGGDRRVPYNETNPTAPVNHYGQSKVWAEDFVRTSLQRFYIVRTALVFGRSRPTFIDRVARSCISGTPLTAATDIVNSPTSSSDLANAIAFLIESHSYGTIHIVNEGYCSRYELACFIAQSLGKNTDFIKKGKKEDLRLKAPRPGYTPLDNFVWKLNGFTPLRTWQDAVKSHLSTLKDEWEGKTL